MYSEKTAREMLKVNAQDTITSLKNFIEDINDGEDLVYLGLSIDRITNDLRLRDILENCEDY